MTQTNRSPWQKHSAAAGKKKTRREKSPESPAAKPGKTLLVVHSEPALRKANVQRLRGLGYRVFQAASILQARRIATHRRRIDLLFVDISHLGGNALELVRWFQSVFPATKALVTTDCLAEVLYHNGQAEQFVALTKPFSDRELREMVQRTLD